MLYTHDPRETLSDLAIVAAIAKDRMLLQATLKPKPQDSVDAHQKRESNAYRSFSSFCCCAATTCASVSRARLTSIKPKI